MIEILDLVERGLSSEDGSVANGHRRYEDKDKRKIFSKALPKSRVEAGQRIVTNHRNSMENLKFHFPALLKCETNL